MPPTHTHLATTPPPRPPKRGSGRLAWALAAAIAIVLVAGGAFALGTLADRHDHGHGVTAPTEVLPTVDAPSTSSATTPQPAPPVAADSTSATPSPSRSAGKVDPTSSEGVARSLSALMSDSQVDKSDVSRASSDLQSCQRVAAAVLTFQGAAASRQRLVQQVAAIDTHALPGAQEVVTELSRAWGTAAQADAAYVAWGRSFRRVGAKCVDSPALQRRASNLSVQTHPYKQAAARAWAPIARRFGLPAVAWDQL